MSRNVQDFIKTPKGKRIVVICLVIMFLGWGYVFFSLFSGMNKLFPSEQDIAAAKEMLQGSRKEWLIQVQHQKELDALKQKYSSICDSCWNTQTDGDAEVLLRERIEQAAVEADVVLSSLGTVKVTKINDELSFAEIDVNFTASLEKIIRFMESISKMTPVLYWSSVDFRIDFMRRFQMSAGNTAKSSSDNSSDHSVQKAKTTNLVSADENTRNDNENESLRFSGAIRVICYSGQKTT